MQLFYLPEITGNLITLPEDESKHCIRVLRLSKGDEIQIVDGKGNFVNCSIVDPSPKRCVVSVLKKEAEFGKRNFHLHIAIAPTKNIDRFEWFLEKVTEIGIDEITPLLCEHSERKSINHERSLRVMIAAMKQSVKAYLPILNPMTPIKDLVKNSSEQTKLMAYCGDFMNPHIKNYLQKGSRVLVLIGPEGDFSPSEVQLAQSYGFKTVGLGTARLRTETAGVIACGIVNFLNEI